MQNYKGKKKLESPYFIFFFFFEK